MNGNSEKSGSWSWFWNFLILLFIVGFVVWISIPNFISNGHDKGMYIFYNLMQIDGAKNEWALESGITNVSKRLGLTIPLLKKI